MDSDPIGPETLVSAAVIGEWTGLHERQVRKLAERGVIERDGKGRYRFKPTLLLICTHSRAQAAGRLGVGDADNPDLPRERALLAQAQREGQVMRNAVLRAELITVPDMETVVGGLVDTVKVRFLAMPTRTAPQLVGLTSPQLVLSVLTDAVHDVLEALANTQIVSTIETVKGRTQIRAGARDDLPREPADE